MSDDFKMTDDDVQMPLGVGSEAGESQEILFTPEKKPRNGATLALIGIFAAGIAAIYLLGMQHKPRSADAAPSEQEVKVDSAIEALLSKSSDQGKLDNLYKNTERLVTLFREAPDTGTTLRDNPFVRSSTHQEPLLQAASGSVADQERLRRAAESFAGLKLESVMMSKNLSAAMINHKIVTVGAKVGEFTVLAIESERVLLGFGSTQFELKVQRKGLEPVKE
ncbi:MAG: hypothetical protein WCI73_02795 [Phycisphaerae bacterium]